MELSAYAFSALREGQFTLYRGLGDGLAPILLVAPAGEYPSLGSLQRLEHEYAFKAELDAAWAARPVALSRQDDRTGAGLDPAIAQRIFEPFFTTKSDGLGVGLSICRSIIEAHGGRLWVSPRALHGTALRFTVPIRVEM
jgi:hypothetical protein